MMLPIVNDRAGHSFAIDRSLHFRLYSIEQASSGPGACRFGGAATDSSGLFDRNKIRTLLVEKAECYARDV